MVPAKKLILALQYWRGDYEQAMSFARFVASLEKAFREDVVVWFVPRFDAPEPDRATVAAVQARFRTESYRTKRRGTGHPSGCNDMWHDLVGEAWRRCLQVKGFQDAHHGVYSIEADNVPLRADWLDAILAEWREALAAGKVVLGCRMESPAPHINGNLLFVPELFGKVRGLEGCPSQYAWDVFHAPKWLDKAGESKLIANFYRATDVPKKKLYEAKGAAKYAVVHGVKDDSALQIAQKMLSSAKVA